MTNSRVRPRDHELEFRAHNNIIIIIGAAVGRKHLPFVFLILAEGCCINNIFHPLDAVSSVTHDGSFLLLLFLPL